MLSLSLVPTEVSSEHQQAFFSPALTWLHYRSDLWVVLLLVLRPLHVALKHMFGRKVRRKAHKTLKSPSLHVYGYVPCIISLWIVRAS